MYSKNLIINKVMGKYEICIDVETDRPNDGYSQKI